MMWRTRKYHLAVIVVGSLYALFAPCSRTAGSAIPDGTFYVSPVGDDGSDGSFDNPFATIGRAKTAVRGLISGGLTNDVLVYIRGGDYYLDQTLMFEAADSGTAAHSITYRAYPGEVVHLIGGRRVQPEWFTTVTDSEIISRLPSGMESNVLVADLAAQGFTTSDYGTLNWRGFPWDYVPGAMELFFNYHPMRLARWPNTGYESAYQPSDGNPLKFVYTAGIGNSAHWGTAEAMWVHGFFASYYGDAIIPAASVDTTDHIITLVDTGSAYAKMNWSLAPIYYVFNLLEEIDQPGEWYLNRTTGKLYFYPPADISGAKIHISMIDKIMYFNGASYLNFEGLILEMCRHFIVESSNSQSVHFNRCLFRNAGTDAAYISGTNIGLDGCVIYDMGDGGVTMCGGDRNTLTRSTNFLRNSLIHHLSRWGKTYKMAATLRDCGHDVVHNLIHDLPAIAVLMKKTNENRIEYNEIYNVCQQVDDNGVIYGGRDWTGRGNTVHYNFIHHINRIPEAAIIKSVGQCGVQGIYLDDGWCGTSVFGNILYVLEGSAIKINGGRDNLTNNNIFAYCPAGLQISRMINSPIFESNYNTLMLRLSQMPYTTPPWSDYYPSLVNILDDQPREPKGDTLYRNIGYNVTSQWVHEEVYDEWTQNPRQFLNEQDNLENTDPCFVDETNLNLNLQPTSPAYTIPGWQDIPFDQIGLSPTAPVLYLTMDTTNFIISGQCEPWATEQIAIIRETGQDIASQIVIADNGAISGTIPRASVSSTLVTVELVTGDPKNHYSPVGNSNTLDVDSCWNYPSQIKGDANGDGKCNNVDLLILRQQWLKSYGSPGYNCCANFSQSSSINNQDLLILRANWLGTDLGGSYSTLQCLPGD